MVASSALAAKSGRTANKLGFLLIIALDSSNPNLSEKAFREPSKFSELNAKQIGDDLTISIAFSSPYNLAKTLNASAHSSSVIADIPVLSAGGNFEL